MGVRVAGFLNDPILTFDREGDRDDGPVVSAYVELREGVNAVRTVQPDPGVLAYFLMGGDGLPVGIAIHEPIGGGAICEVVSRLLDAPVLAGGGDGATDDRPFPREGLRAVLHGIRKSLEGLQASA